MLERKHKVKFKTVKFKTVPADLRKLSNVVDNDIVRKILYDLLVTKVDAFDTKIPSISGLVTKMQYDSDKQGFEKKIVHVDEKIPNTCGQGQKK